jgi:hypothetical protein
MLEFAVNERSIPGRGFVPTSGFFSLRECKGLEDLASPIEASRMTPVPRIGLTLP